MQRPNGKVTGSLHYLRLSTSVANFIILVFTVLTNELETTNKALSEEKTA
jgi:hypothetical protein